MAEIYLRGLQEKDAPYMLEWMQDPDIACFFRFDAQKMTVDSCRDFILKSGGRQQMPSFCDCQKGYRRVSGNCEPETDRSGDGRSRVCHKHEEKSTWDGRCFSGNPPDMGNCL